MSKTISQFAADMMSNPSEAQRKRNPELFQAGLPQGKVNGDTLAETLKRPRADFLNPQARPVPKSAEEKLNKTEKAYLSYMRAIGDAGIHIQAVTLKLAEDCRLTCDFTYQNTCGQTVFVDVKGFQREDALIKMKVAAAQFPEYRFVIVKKTKDGWDHRWL